MKFLSNERRERFLILVLIEVLLTVSAKTSEPLILTPLLNYGEINKAKNLSLVTYFAENFTSYSGYFTTDQEFKSNIFFWYFPAQINEATAPLLIWLNGGPGSSSLFGLFVENGPMIVDTEKVIKLRTSTWTLTNSIIYIDSPVGTGFSFTRNESGYATNIDDVTKGLYSTLIQFFMLFPELRPRPLYLTGESYAGKYIPHFAYHILQENYKIASDSLRINLNGLSIGNGFIDPKNSMNYPDFLYDIGLLDENGRDKARRRIQMIDELVYREEWEHAFQKYDEFIGYTGLRDNFLTRMTGLEFYYNLLVAKRPPDYDYFKVFVNKPRIREALHVGYQGFDNGSKVLSKLRGDIMKSAKHVLEFLLNNGMRTLIYNGQLDIIVPNRLTDDFLKTLKWFGVKEFHNCTRKIWKVRNEVAGYYKNHLNLTRLTVRECGHMVPYDKPKRAFHMINSFISGKFDRI